MEDYPPHHKLYIANNLIEQLRGGGERKLWWQDIFNIVDTLMEQYPIFYTDISSNISFYRARKVTKENKINDIKKMSCRDLDLIHDYGRCHIPKRQVLYASDNLATVCEEIGAHTGDYIQIIEFNKIEQSPIKITSIGEIDNVRRHNRTSQITTEEINNHLHEILDTLDNITKTRLELTDAFFADQFRKNAKYEYEYKITSALSEILYKQGVEGFFYPSVRHLGGWNISILGECFNKNFKIGKSCILQITESYNYGIHNYKTISISDSISDDGAINWQVGNKLVSYESFGSFMNHALSHPGNNKYLFLLLFKSIESGLSKEELISQYPNVASHAFPEDAFAFKLINEFTAPLRSQLGFETLKKQIDEQVGQDWDYLHVCCLTTLGTEEKNKEIQERVKNGNTSADYPRCTLNREGELLPIIYLQK